MSQGEILVWIADLQKATAKTEQEIFDVVQEMKAAIAKKDFEQAVRLREREIELREDVLEPQYQKLNLLVNEVSEEDLGDFVVIWNPEVVAPSDYAELVCALGDLVRVSGGLGVFRNQTQNIDVSLPAGVCA